MTHSAQRIHFGPLILWNFHEKFHRRAHFFRRFGVITNHICDTYTIVSCQDSCQYCNRYEQEFAIRVLKTRQCLVRTCIYRLVHPHLL